MPLFRNFRLRVHSEGRSQMDHGQKRRTPTPSNRGLPPQPAAFMSQHSWQQSHDATGDNQPCGEACCSQLQYGHRFLGVTPPGRCDGRIPVYRRSPHWALTHLPASPQTPEKVTHAKQSLFRRYVDVLRETYSSSHVVVALALHPYRNGGDALSTYIVSNSGPGSGQGLHIQGLD